MLRRLGLMGLLGLGLLGLGTASTGCVVRETRVARPVQTCQGGIWVEPRRDGWGRWHEGHWRCPGGRWEGHARQYDTY